MPHDESIPAKADVPSIDNIDEMIREIAREGARALLQSALESEIEYHLNRHRDLRTQEQRQMVVRNGHAPQRRIQTGIGPVSIRRPRIDERQAVKQDPKHRRFTSGVLPRFLRRTPTIEGVVATLYLKGISTNDFEEALKAIYGEEAGSLSASTVSRMKEAWEGEYEGWRTKRLSAKQYAYIWADGVYFNARIEGERSCLLVVIGAKYNGEKELLAVTAGYRESSESWKELLLELKSRGMSEDPKLAIADGALGFWKALPQVFPTTKGQRCWVHKTANVLDKLPKRVQPRAKTLLHDIYMAETEREANKAFDHFIKAYSDKYPKASETLRKDRDALMAFYRFPAAHWKHIRSTNVIESVFATVRLRTYKTKGLGTHSATLAMTFKLLQEAQKGWHRIGKWKQLEFVQAGRSFKDGILVEDSAA
ncbi:MAG: IS256 family transposase [Acidobacteriota bacterium]